MNRCQPKEALKGKSPLKFLNKNQIHSQDQSMDVGCLPTDNFDGTAI